MNYEELAKVILEKVGGKDNVANATHCATRLRLNLKDESIADTEALKATPGIVGIASKNGQYQVIIGAEVLQVYQKLSKMLPEGEKNTVPTPAENKGSFVGRLIDTVTGIFTPILPALTAAGMIKAVLALLVAFKLVQSSSNTYQVINFMGDATFLLSAHPTGQLRRQEAGLQSLSGHDAGRHPDPPQLHLPHRRRQGERGSPDRFWAAHL